MPMRTPKRTPHFLHHPTLVVGNGIGAKRQPQRRRCPLLFHQLSRIKQVVVSVVMMIKYAPGTCAIIHSLITRGSVYSLNGTLCTILYETVHDCYVVQCHVDGQRRTLSAINLTKFVPSAPRNVSLARGGITKHVPPTASLAARGHVPQKFSQPCVHGAMCRYIRNGQDVCQYQHTDAEVAAAARFETWERTKSAAAKASLKPTAKPFVVPSIQPTAKPIVSPSLKPTAKPALNPQAKSISAGQEAKSSEQNAVTTSSNPPEQSYAAKAATVKKRTEQLSTKSSVVPKEEKKSSIPPQKEKEKIESPQNDEKSNEKESGQEATKNAAATSSDPKVSYAAKVAEMKKRTEHLETLSKKSPKEGKKSSIPPKKQEKMPKEQDTSNEKEIPKRREPRFGNPFDGSQWTLSTIRRQPPPKSTKLSYAKVPSAPSPPPTPKTSASSPEQTPTPPPRPEKILSCPEKILGPPGVTPKETTEPEEPPKKRRETSFGNGYSHQKASPPTRDEPSRQDESIFCFGQTAVESCTDQGDAKSLAAPEPKRTESMNPAAKPFSATTTSLKPAAKQALNPQAKSTKNAETSSNPQVSYAAKAAVKKTRATTTDGIQKLGTLSKKSSVLPKEEKKSAIPPKKKEKTVVPPKEQEKSTVSDEKESDPMRREPRFGNPFDGSQWTLSDIRRQPRPSSTKLSTPSPSLLNSPSLKTSSSKASSSPEQTPASPTPPPRPEKSLSRQEKSLSPPGFTPMKETTETTEPPKKRRETSFDNGYSHQVASSPRDEPLEKSQQDESAFCFGQTAVESRTDQGDEKTLAAPVPSFETWARKRTLNPAAKFFSVPKTTASLKSTAKQALSLQAESLSADQEVKNAAAATTSNPQESYAAKAAKKTRATTTDGIQKLEILSKKSSVLPKEEKKSSVPSKMKDETVVLSKEQEKSNEKKSDPFFKRREPRFGNPFDGSQWTLSDIRRQPKPSSTKLSTPSPSLLKSPKGSSPSPKASSPTPPPSPEKTRPKTILMRPSVTPMKKTTESEEPPKKRHETSLGNPLYGYSHQVAPNAAPLRTEPTPSLEKSRQDESIFCFGQTLAESRTDKGDEKSLAAPVPSFETWARKRTLNPAAKSFSVPKTTASLKPMAKQALSPQAESFEDKSAKNAETSSNPQESYAAKAAVKKTCATTTDGIQNLEPLSKKSSVLPKEEKKPSVPSKMNKKTVVPPKEQKSMIAEEKESDPFPLRRDHRFGNPSDGSQWTLSEIREKATSLSTKLSTPSPSLLKTPSPEATSSPKAPSPKTLSPIPTPASSTPPPRPEKILMRRPGFTPMKETTEPEGPPKKRRELSIGDPFDASWTFARQVTPTASPPRSQPTPPLEKSRQDESVFCFGETLIESRMEQGHEMSLLGQTRVQMPHYTSTRTRGRAPVPVSSSTRHDDALLAFLKEQEASIKGTPLDFYNWLVESESIASLEDLAEAVGDEDYLKTVLKTGDGKVGVKGFKLKKFLQAVLHACTSSQDDFHVASIKQNKENIVPSSYSRHAPVFSREVSRSGW